MTTTARWIATVACAALIATAFAPLTTAHATLEKSSPAAGSTLTAPPPHVQLRFNEKVDLAVSMIGLSGPAGKVAIGKPSAVEPKTLMALVTGNMVDGRHTVAWQTAGDDGHVEKGTYTFVLKRGR